MMMMTKIDIDRQYNDQNNTSQKDTVKTNMTQKNKDLVTGTPPKKWE
jgi:hypothetical protein